MSASLVGSEMCIRDRQSIARHSTHRGATPNKPTTRWRLTKECDAAPSQQLQKQPRWYAAQCGRPSETH
eukprot:7261116-Alexandrium_andersonii.AAC.1